MKKRVELGSSAIAEIIYDSKKHTLEVLFRDSDRYRYFNVPPLVVDTLLAAKSAGAFWNSVKDNYRYKKLR